MDLMVEAFLVADAGGWDHMGGWDWPMVVGWLAMALVVVATVWLISSSTRGWRDHNDRPPSALDVLDDRYARGEIDRTEYLERKADLKD